MTKDSSESLLSHVGKGALRGLANRLMTDGAPGKGVLCDENRQRAGEKNRPHSPPPVTACPALWCAGARSVKEPLEELYPIRFA